VIANGRFEHPEHLRGETRAEAMRAERAEGDTERAGK
jgi:hypothetical protein